MAVSPVGWGLGVSGSERSLSANDAEVNVAVEDYVKETRLLAGKLVRYKAPLHKLLHWQFQYAWLFGKDEYIYDGGMGYDSLLALKLADVEMNLIVPNDVGASTTYVVRFTAGAWQARLRLRQGDRWAWSLNFELVQAT